MVVAATGLISASAQTNTWTQLSPSGGPPTARYGHSAVLNPANGRMIVFGGIFGTVGAPPLGNDVWIFSDARTNGGNTWQQLTTSGTPPSARGLQSAVYDPTNNRMIIFGGDPNVGNCFVDVNDTWVLTNADGTGGTSGWTQLSPSSPPPGRSSASAVYDSANNRMIIYGGNLQCGMTYTDLWVLSNANGLGGSPVWTQLNPSNAGPGARTAHFAAYDSANNRMILFGGTTAFGYTTNDVWILSNANGLGGTPVWTQLNPAGPLPAGRAYFAAAYDPVLNTLAIFGGGSTAGYTNDAWVLSNANGLGGVPAWTQLNVSDSLPGVRAQFAGVGIPGATRLVICDGVFSSIYNDVWALQYVPVSGLVGQWHLDEGSGSTTADSAGSHPGALINSPTWVTGVHSNALSFDGSSQYVRLNSGPILGTNANLTIEAWVNPDNNSTYGMWEVYGEGGANTAVELALQDNFNGTYNPTFDTGGSSVTMPSALAVNQWHHLAAVLQSGVGGILYVDGQPVATNASMTAPSYAATETDLARLPMGARYFGGVIDEVQAYDAARTPAQVLADYQQYTPPPPPPASADLAIGQTVSPDPVMMNSNVTYTIAITNFGPNTASNVVVTNYLDGGEVSYLTVNSMSQVAPGSGGGYSFGGNYLYLYFGTLASNATATAVFTTVAQMPFSNFDDTCAVGSSVSDPNSTNNSASTLLTILAPPPSITSQPTNLTVSAGGTATLSVGTSGYSIISFQWLFDGTNIAGATGPSLTLTNTALNAAGDYSVIVSNVQGVVTSAVAVVSVINLQIYAGITIGGPVGTNYEVDYVNDLNNSNWVTLTNLMLPSDPYLFIDTTSPGNTHRFYRVLQN